MRILLILLILSIVAATNVTIAFNQFKYAAVETTSDKYRERCMSNKDYPIYTDLIMGEFGVLYRTGSLMNLNCYTNYPQIYNDTITDIYGILIWRGSFVWAGSYFAIQNGTFWYKKNSYEIIMQQLV